MADVLGGRGARIVLSMLLGLPAGLTAADGLVIVHVENRAQVRASDLARATAEAERVFDAAGVAITWADPKSTAMVVALNAVRRDSRRVLVVLTTMSDAPTRTSACALGVALPAAASAYVFHDRISDMSARHPVDVPIVLGRVIAHEIGHLLLPAGSHTRQGIMRGDLDIDFVNPHRFTEQQAHSMRTSLAPGSKTSF